MNRPYLSLATLVIFSLYTAGTMLMSDQSLVDFGIELVSSPDTAQVVIDLYLLGFLACFWMYRDARSRGKSTVSLVPYFLITALFLSIGPLLYIVIKGFARPQQISLSIATDGAGRVERRDSVPRGTHHL